MTLRFSTTTQTLFASSSVKLLIELKSFVVWIINVADTFIKIDLRSYARVLLKEHEM